MTSYKNNNTGPETVSQWKSNYLKTQLFWDWFVFKWGVLKWRQFKREYIWSLEVARKYWRVCRLGKSRQVPKTLTEAALAEAKL